MNKVTKIAINASFLRKQNTGLGQVTVNFIQKLMEITSAADSEQAVFSHANLEFVLFLEEDIELQLPANFTKVIFLPRYRRDDLIRKVWWELISLPKKVKAFECEVLLSLYQCPTVLRSKLRSKQKIKHIMVVHDIIPRIFPHYLNNWRKKLYQKLTELAIKKADKIITVSRYSEKDLIKRLVVEPQKITACHIDVDPIYKQLVEPEKMQSVLAKYDLTEGYIYSGGGLEVRKNTESVLRAYKILFEAYGKASWLPKLVISGKLMPQLAPLVTDVTQLVEGLGLQGQVELLDWVPQEDLPALYRGAKLFVYPSLYEGFGLPILEAMNQGTPVITAKTSSLPEVGSDAVLYCDPQKVDDLAMVMRNVLINDHLQAALSLKGRERARYFEMEKFVKKIINIVCN